MEDINFMFDYVHVLHYKYHKITLNRSGSYIDSPEEIKNKKAKINSKIVITDVFNMQ